MRIVVDTNIVFSAIYNTNSRIGKIFLHPKSRLNFYSTDQLIDEINTHKGKLIKLTTYTEQELEKISTVITNRIRFINVRLIPQNIYEEAFNLTKDTDIDDTEFVALTEHLKGKFWSGDKKLLKSLETKKWNRTIDTDSLYRIVTKTK